MGRRSPTSECSGTTAQAAHIAGNHLASAPACHDRCSPVQFGPTVSSKPKKMAVMHGRGQVSACRDYSMHGWRVAVSRWIDEVRPPFVFLPV